MVAPLLEALSWFTVLPVRVTAPRGLAACVPALPAVGLVVGGIAALSGAAAGHTDPYLGGVVATVVGLGLTGFIHLDGVADLADGLAASHLDPGRRLVVMKDPHTGAMGAAAVALAVASRVVLLVAVASCGAWGALPLAAAWARLGAWGWAVTLPPLGDGMGYTLHHGAPRRGVARWGVALFLLSLWLAPAMALAPLPLLAWGGWLRRSLGGQNGDTLGAGIEVVELLLFATAVVGAGGG